jgi:hypothetical protein
MLSVAMCHLDGLDFRRPNGGRNSAASWCHLLTVASYVSEYRRRFYRFFSFFFIFNFIPKRKNAALLGISSRKTVAVHWGAN